jgi:uncharacterized protein involved in exopolysaccharide biosynthesis
VNGLEGNVSSLSQKLKQTEENLQKKTSEMQTQEKNMKDEIAHEKSQYSTEHEKTKEIGVLQGKLTSLKQEASAMQKNLEKET